jgi:hypothetical protein
VLPIQNKLILLLLKMNNLSFGHQISAINKKIKKNRIIIMNLALM